LRIFIFCFEFLGKFEECIPNVCVIDVVNFLHILKTAGVEKMLSYDPLMLPKYGGTVRNQ